jgi:hypothetical protein
MFKGLFQRNKKAEAPRAKYKLRPDAHGTYTLLRWEGLYYLPVCVMITPEDADKSIANLERETLYYRES